MGLRLVQLPELKRTNQEKLFGTRCKLLLVPFMLAICGFWLNRIQKNREERAIEQRDKTEREIAKDNQQETALQTYIDKMSELLLLRRSA